MEGTNPANMIPKKRPALGDITNCLGKRGLTLISGNKNVDGKEAISQFTKRVCQGVENIVKEKCMSLDSRNENDKNKSACVLPKHCKDISLVSGNVSSASSKMSGEIKEADSVICSLQKGKENVIIENVVKIDEVTGNSCDIKLLIDSSKENCDKDDEQDLLNVVEGCSQTGESVTEIYEKDIEGNLVGNLTRKHGMVDFSVGPESHVSGSFKLEKCKGLVGDSCCNPGGGIDSLKSCSCSFCMKAAYIWSDLQFQDTKGRISALKKSQKEASIMRERVCRNKGNEKPSQGNNYNVSKLEPDLTGQWRSLFLHMENIFEREGNQLETSLVSLQGLRENCKTELEMVNEMPREKH